MSYLPVLKQNIVNKFMGKILVISNSDFSRNSIVKVDIEKQVENTVESQTLSSYSSSTVLDNNSSLKNNNQ